MGHRDESAKKAVSPGRPQTMSRSARTSAWTREYCETIWLLVKMMGVIFACEAAIMGVFAVVPLSASWSIIVDPVLLTLLATPVLYGLLVRPICRALEERKKAQEQSLEYQKQLRALAAQLSLTEDRERHRLATNLHDQISQSLIACKMQLDRLRAQSPSVELEETAHSVCDELGQVIQRTRNLIYELSSPMLYELGLEMALQDWLRTEVQQRRGIATELADDGQDKPLDDDIRAIMFRNVRELLTTVLRQTRTTKVKVSLRRVDPDIHVCIEDGARGFDVAAGGAAMAQQVELALLGVRERLELIGGSLTIETTSAGGTRITMTAPLAHTSIP